MKIYILSGGFLWDDRGINIVAGKPPKKAHKI
jgi:hypothetical protein